MDNGMKKLIKLLYEVYRADREGREYSDQMVEYVAYSMKLFGKELDEYGKRNGRRF